jgi:hypothetical protein
MTTARGSWQSQVVNLDHFKDTPVLNIENWPGGYALVTAKVLCENNDGDKQKYEVWLSHGYPQQKVMDYTSAGLPGRYFLWVTVTGWSYIPAREIIQLRCSTYKGFAVDARLTAILVDNFGSPIDITAPPTLTTPIGERRARSRPRPSRIGHKVRKRRK